MDAIVLAHCLNFNSPSMDASEARRKHNVFNKFMDSLDWDLFTKRAEEKAKPKTAEDTVKALFGGMSIVPFRKKNKGQDDK